MKYCTKCGAQLHDEAVFCTSCGRPTSSYNQATEKKASSTSGLQTAAKIFMIVGTVITSLYGFLIPLAWCLPMTLFYCDKIKKGEPVSIGFKVCSLLFVNTIAGILMLCDSGNNNK